MYHLCWNDFIFPFQIFYLLGFDHTNMIDLNHHAVLPVAFFILVTTLKLVAKYVIAGEILRYRKKTFDSDIKLKKYRIAVYKLIYGTISVIMGMFVLHGEKWILKLDFTPDLKDGVIPLKFKAHYILEGCFYINELFTMAFEPAKHDLVQMALHHITTLLLMYLSYTPKYIKFGVLLIPLHNITDPMLEFCKVCNYLKDDLCANVGLFVFTTAFIILRLLIYPRYVLWNAWKFTQQDHFKSPSLYIMTLLFILQVMHIIWTMYIIMLFVRIINGEKPKDPREVTSKKD